MRLREKESVLGLAVVLLVCAVGGALGYGAGGHEGILACSPTHRHCRAIHY